MDGVQFHGAPESSWVQIAATFAAPVSSARTQVSRWPAGTAAFRSAAAISGVQSQVSQGAEDDGSRINQTAASFFRSTIGSTRKSLSRPCAPSTCWDSWSGVQPFVQPQS